MRARLSDIIGDDHFVRLDKIGIASVYLKLENLNPAGSIKFKTALGLINSFEAADAIAGAIAGDTILIESSSGNLGVALSVICAERGYRFTCVVDPNTNPMNIRYMPRASIPSPIGTILLVSDDEAVRALDFEAYQDRMHRLLRRHYGSAGEQLLQLVRRQISVSWPGLSRPPTSFADVQSKLAALGGIGVRTGGPTSLIGQRR